MLKIDIHTHILPKAIPDFMKKFGYGGFIKLEHHKSCCARMLRDDGTFFREIEHNCWDADVRLKECEKSGIKVQVLSTVPVMFSYWAKPKDALEVSRFINDDIAHTVSRYPKNFVGLGTVPLQDEELACLELRRCIEELGLRGVEIGTHINGDNLDHRRFREFFRLAEQLGAAIFVHPWDMMGSDSMQKYWLPWLVGMPAESSRAICSMLFGGVFEQFKDLRVAFAHGGGAFPATFGRIVKGYEARPDLCAVDNPHHPTKYLGHFYLDTLVHDVKILQLLVELIGAERLAIGSDYPFPLGEDSPGSIVDELQKSFKSTPSVMNALCHGSALQWLGLKKSDFLE
ncbi:MAG: amidohydrolase [Oligoflexales bacterium]|nr:amidohydrolase [Oligoflexales bacterium]